MRERVNSLDPKRVREKGRDRETKVRGSAREREKEVEIK